MVAHRAADLPDTVEFACTRRFAMVGDDLFGKRRARARHADDKDRNIAVASDDPAPSEELRAESAH